MSIPTPFLFCLTCGASGTDCDLTDCDLMSHELRTKKQILNLTAHEPSLPQEFAGVWQDKGWDPSIIDFRELPTVDDLQIRASKVADFAETTGAKWAMIGGAPFFQAPLATALRERGITPLFAFSRRESRDIVLDDGATAKRSVFVHLGFVEAIEPTVFVATEERPGAWEESVELRGASTVRSDVEDLGNTVSVFAPVGGE